MSPVAPGTYVVVAQTDHGNVLLEWDEANNAFTWTVDVVPGPVTDLVLGAPNVTAVKTFVTSATDLSLSVLDQSGVGIRSTWYRLDNTSWMNYTATGPFRLSEEGAHFLEWYSEDFAGNVEAVQSMVLTSDDTPPTTALTVGDPKHLVGGTFVTSTTLISPVATDGGADPVGVAFMEYLLDGGSWLPAASPFTLVGEGLHTVAFRSADRLGNLEPTQSLAIMVDNTPPTLVFAIGTPQYASTQLFVKSSTPFTILASDGGPVPVGVASVAYRVDGGIWTAYTAPISVSLPDGPHRVEYAAADHLGNPAFDARDAVIDDTPPETAMTPANGPLTVETVVTLSATDAGSGLARTDIWVDEQGWTTYGGGFALPAGNHVIRYRSVDRLGNVEAEQTVSVTVEGAPPPPQTNWKPVVAAAFSVVVAVAGWRFSSRAEEFSTHRRRRRFAMTSLPFVVAEATTGIASFFTGLLSIPPILGLGMVVDGSILVGGLAVAFYSARQLRTP
jgi:membrane protein implicated in regulation of membrane protease activity